MIADLMLFAYLSDYFRGIAHGHAVVRDVFRHHAARPYDAPLAYGDAGAHDHSAAKPCVLADGYGVSRLHCLAPQHVVFRMVGRVELAVRADFHVVFQRDIASVKHRAVVVDKHVAAYLDTVAVVAMERRADGAVLRDAGDEVFDGFTVAVACQRHRLQPRAYFLCMSEARKDFRVGEVVQLLAAHLFKFGHGCMW